MSRIFNEPVLLGTAIRATILAVAAFGFHITADQIAALMLAVESIIALVTRAFVTPNHLAEARVAMGLSPTLSRDNAPVPLPPQNQPPLPGDPDKNT